MYWVFGSQSKFTAWIRVHQTAFNGCNFGGLCLFHQMFVFYKICWVLFNKFSYCAEIFMSIQVVLNVWEEFEVQNPNIFALQWTLAAYNFFIQSPFSIIFVGKVAHTSLVCMVKFHINPKSYEWMINILVGGSGIDVFFATFVAIFLTFQSHFANAMSQLNEIFLHQCVCMLVLKHFIVQSFFIWVGLEIESHLQMCFQENFSIFFQH